MHVLAQVCLDEKRNNTSHPLFALHGRGASMVTIEEIAQQTRPLDERCQHVNGERARMTTAMVAQETRIGSLRESQNLLRARIDGITADLRDKAKFMGGEDKATCNEKQADKMRPPTLKGEKRSMVHLGRSCQHLGSVIDRQRSRDLPRLEQDEIRT